MTTFTAITSAQVDAESYIDTTLAGQWSNNFLAMFEGDASASAVRLQTAAIDAAAVTRAKITTATVSAAGNVPQSTNTNISLTHYCFFPMIHCTGGAEVTMTGNTVDGASADSPSFGFYNSSATTDYSYDVDYRHIDA